MGKETFRGFIYFEKSDGLVTQKKIILKSANGTCKYHAKRSSYLLDLLLFNGCTGASYPILNTTSIHCKVEQSFEDTI